MSKQTKRTKPKRSVPRSTKREKPGKPYPGFPLTAHPCGQWCKKVQGKIRYFGPWDDPTGARDRWLAEKDHLLAGQAPPSRDARNSLTVDQLCDQYLEAKKLLVESGDLSPRTLVDYTCILKIVRMEMGSKVAADLEPLDFGKLRRRFARTHNATTLSSDVTKVKVMFNWAYTNELLDKPVRYGSYFKKPSRKAMRNAKQNRGKRMFDAEQIRAMLDKASPNLKAMILLGINCGLGNDDCAKLTFGHLGGDPTGDWKWLNYPRPKTAIMRRCPLWPETRDALKIAMKESLKRNGTKRPGDRVFINSLGNTYDAKSDMDNPISKATVKLLQSLGYHRPGLAFYSFRRTFATLGYRVDKDATKSIMGHAESANDMSAVYNQEAVQDRRLVRVAKYVRRWLFKSNKGTK